MKPTPFQQTLFRYGPAAATTVLIIALSLLPAYAFRSIESSLPRLPGLDKLIHGAMYAVLTATYLYDANGNRTQMTDANGSTAWVYDNLDRITQVTDPFSNTIGYAYDLPSDVRKRIVYPGTTPSSGNVDYAFDDNGRLQTLTDWAGHTFTYHYDSAGNVVWQRMLGSTGTSTATAMAQDLEAALAGALTSTLETQMRLGRAVADARRQLGKKAKRPESRSTLRLQVHRSRIDLTRRPKG